MKMAIVLAVFLALSSAASSASALLQMPLVGLEGSLYPCAEYLRQPQCSPVSVSVVASPFYYALRQQSMWLPMPSSIICQPLQQQCCQQMRMMDELSRCQAMCGVVQSVVQHLQLQAAIRGVAAVINMYQPAMAVAQVAQNMPAMCGLYQLPSYCTAPCAVAALAPY